MATLKILTGSMRDQTFELKQEGWAKTLGRGTEKVDISIPDASASRRHAEFSYRDGQWMVRDLGSSNGTFINEMRIHGPTLLYNGDQVRCGATVMLFESDMPELLRPKQDGTVELAFDPGETMVAIAFDSLQSRQTAQQRKRMMQAGQAALNMSHGIKNILQAVRSGQDLIDDAFSYRDLDQARKAWGILKRNLEKIQKLVLDMLKFSREESPRLQPCQLNRLAETVISLLRPQAEERQVGLLLQTDEEVGQVPADPDQMQDVLINLIMNAIEAVPASNGQVIVHTELDREGSCAVLRVSDNGKGIENVDEIFEPFHSDKPNVGTGLGLTIARKIVQMHKGTINVQSVPGEGSIFTVRLPLK